MRYTKFSLRLCTLLVLINACTPNYGKYARQYNFTNASVVPNYNNLDYWAAHPWKKDLSDSVPAPLRNEDRDSVVDVFFIYPTTYTGEKKGVNADGNDAELNAKTDYTTILYQASVFNQHARVFSPRYRQMHFSQFFISPEESKPAFDTAYSDVKTAFEFYLAHYNKSRPMIIAGHSQGALMAQRLLKEYVDGKPMQRRLVAAYIVGWPVPQDYFSNIPVCASPRQTDCFCSWRTYRTDYIPEHIQKELPRAVVTNPLRWDTTSVYAGKEMNTGAVLRNFNELVAGVADAQVHDGVLWTTKPSFKGSFLLRTKNYHIADINFFYGNIRKNVEQRINAYWKQ